MSYFVLYIQLKAKRAIIFHFQFSVFNYRLPVFPNYYKRIYNFETTALGKPQKSHIEAKIVRKIARNIIRFQKNGR